MATIVDVARIRYISEDWPGVPPKLYVRLYWRLSGEKRYQVSRTENAIYYTPVRILEPQQGDTRQYIYTETIDPNPPGTPAHWMQIEEIS